MTFNDIVALTLDFEGGFSDHKDDRGGATMHGITTNTLKTVYQLAPELLLPKHVSELTLEQAHLIYQRFYYEGPNIHLLHWAVQQVVFDIAVNHGPQQAVKLVQRVCNLSGIVVIQEDGIIGPMTIRSVDRVYRAMGNLLINAICDERILFYRAICANDPTQQIFLHGWLRRANAFKLKGTCV